MPFIFLFDRRYGEWKWRALFHDPPADVTPLAEDTQFNNTEISETFELQQRTEGDVTVNIG